GGNFGTRGGFNPEFAIVAWAARRVGRPVKWTSDRSEYFQADHQARDLAVSAELALDDDGNFLAMRGSNLVNQGAYALAFGSLNKGVEIMSSIYHVPHVHFRARAALTNTPPTRPYRSSGRREAARRRGKCRGIGVANYVDTATGAPREKAEMHVSPSGTVEIVIGTVSQGQGHETSFAQLVTEWLGVPLDSVRLVTGDTA